MDLARIKSGISTHLSLYCPWALTYYTLINFYVVYPLRVRQEIERICQSSNAIIVVPWFEEVGMELLYWIPFLNWVRAEFDLNKDRVTVISRGGVAQWYRNICGNYIDILDYITPEKLKHMNQQPAARLKWQKQSVIISGSQREFLQLVKGALNSDEVRLLYPKLMVKLVGPFWGGQRSIALMHKYTRYQRLPSVDADGLIGELPTDYVAVKFYFSRSFPDTADNRSFVSELLNNLTRTTNVVLLDTGLDIDDHSDYITDTTKRIYSIRHLISPRNNLDVQTRIVSRARAFIGTYGGFSYLAPFYGVPSISFYSHEKFVRGHLDIAYRTFSTLKCGSFIVLNVKDLDLVRFISS